MQHVKVPPHGVLPSCPHHSAWTRLWRFDRLLGIPSTCPHQGHGQESPGTRPARKGTRPVPRQCSHGALLGVPSPRAAEKLWRDGVGSRWKRRGRDQGVRVPGDVGDLRARATRFPGGLPAPSPRPSELLHDLGDRVDVDQAEREPEVIDVLRLARVTLASVQLHRPTLETDGAASSTPRGLHLHAKPPGTAAQVAGGQQGGPASGTHSVACGGAAEPARQMTWKPPSPYWMPASADDEGEPHRHEARTSVTQRARRLMGAPASARGHGRCRRCMRKRDDPAAARTQLQEDEGATRPGPWSYASDPWGLMFTQVRDSLTCAERSCRRCRRRPRKCPPLSGCASRDPPSLRSAAGWPVAVGERPSGRPPERRASASTASRSCSTSAAGSRGSKRLPSQVLLRRKPGASPSPMSRGPIRLDCRGNEGRVLCQSHPNVTTLVHAYC